jgi:RimJ/RimL family protein N-acetyltransferase
MVETIRTERLLLRPLRASDAGPISLHCSDARVARMTAAIPHPYPPGAAQAFIEGTLKGRRAEEVWAIDATPIDGEELIGVAGYQPAVNEVAYWVGVPYWNAGYATEAVLALTQHLLARPGVTRLGANVFAENDASAAVLAKAGFREFGASQVFSAARNATAPTRVFELTRAAPASDGEAAGSDGAGR